MNRLTIGECRGVFFAVAPNRCLYAPKFCDGGSVLHLYARHGSAVSCLHAFELERKHAVLGFAQLLHVSQQCLQKMVGLFR